MKIKDTFGNWDLKLNKIVNDTKRIRVTCSQCGGEFNAPRRVDGKLFGFSSCKEHKGLRNLDEN